MYSKFLTFLCFIGFCGLRLTDFRLWWMSWPSSSLVCHLDFHIRDIVSSTCHMLKLQFCWIWLWISVMFSSKGSKNIPYTKGIHNILFTQLEHTSVSENLETIVWSVWLCWGYCVSQKISLVVFLAVFTYAEGRLKSAFLKSFHSWEVRIISYQTFPIWLTCTLPINAFPA
jgi:hypothetical protein